MVLQVEKNSKMCYFIKKQIQMFKIGRNFSMENPEKIKVGVIGVGALGRHHARLYAQNPGAEVVGIFDVQSETAQKVGAEFGLKVFDSWESLAEKCDALSVAVPATYHGSTTLPLLAMKKHILVEKPIAATVEEAEQMVNAARENGVVFGVGHVERFNPAMDYLHNCHTTPRFIEVHRLAKFPPARPGMLPRGTEVSVILDLMIHDIDLVLSLVRSDVEKIDVFGAPVLSATEDIVNARIKFANGCCAVLTASRVSQDPMRRFRVFQEDSCISMDLGNHCGTIQKRCGTGLVKEDVVLDEKNALAEELDNFLNAVRKTQASGTVTDTKVSGVQGLQALQLAVAIEKEARRYNGQYGFKFGPAVADK